MPLAQSIQYIWVTCVSIVAIIATYHLATQGLLIPSAGEILYGFDGLHWPSKFGPAAASSVSATFKENELQDEAPAESVLATLKENDLKVKTAIDITISETLTPHPILKENDLQNSTELSIPTSPSSIVESTQAPVKNESSDTPAEGDNTSSAQEQPEKLLHGNNNKLWIWFNDSKNAVNTKLFRILSVICVMLPPICLQLRDSWFHIELHRRIEKGLRPSLPAGKDEVPSLETMADLAEPATRDHMSGKDGLDISTVLEHFHARNQIIRHVQRNQTARAGKMRTRALQANKILRQDYLETGKAVMARLKQLEEEVTTLRESAVGFPTPNSLVTAPDPSPTLHPPTPLSSCSSGFYSVLPSLTSRSEMSAPTSDTPTQSKASPLLQPTSPIPRPIPIPTNSAPDEKEALPQLPLTKQQEVTPVTFNPTQSAPSFQSRAPPDSAGLLTAQHHPTSIPRSKIQMHPSSGTFGNLQAFGALEPRSCETPESKTISSKLSDMIPALTSSIPSPISRPEQGPAPPPHLQSGSLVAKELALPSKLLLGPTVPDSRDSKAYNVPKRDTQRPKTKPAIPKFLNPGKPEPPAFLTQDLGRQNKPIPPAFLTQDLARQDKRMPPAFLSQDLTRQNKPKLPAFLMQDSVKQNEQEPVAEPSTPSRLEGMVYDTNIPVKKKLCEADKMCSSRVCGKAHHGPRVNPNRPFTIEAYCIYDQGCKSKNCAKWHGSPASADQ